MAKKRKWAIVSYPVGASPGHAYIQSSIGMPYKELRVLARKLNRNGEGQRYVVKEHTG
jgi:hypothetical protein